MKNTKSLFAVITAFAIAMSLVMFAQGSASAKLVRSSASVTITFDENDGTGTTVDRTFDSGASTVLSFSNPWSRTGYQFMGWSADSSASTPDVSYTATSDASVFAVWQQNPPGFFTVTYSKNDGSGFNKDFVYADGDSTALSVDKIWDRDGYTFLGWSADAQATSADSWFLVSRDTALYAVWVLTTFAVTYDANDGSGNTQTEQWAEGFTGALGEPKIWSRNDYRFLGWSGNPLALLPATTFVVSAEATLYAIWKKNPPGAVTVTYVKNDGSLASQDSNFTIGSRAALSRPNTWTFAGHTFLGWSADPSASTSDSNLTVRAEITLYAVWSVNYYTIVYSANDGSFKTASQVLPYGDSSALDFANTWSRTGFTFAGWSSDTAATTADSSYSVSGDATLYAVWSLNSHTVTYDANDGSGNTQISQLSFGDTTALAQSKIWDRPAFNFVGWSADAAASAADRAFTVSSDATIYAVWAPIKHSITFAANDGTGSTRVVQLNETFAGALGQPKLASRSGYTFLGWSTDSAATSADTAFVVSSDATLYGVWLKNPLGTVTVTYSKNDGSLTSKDALVTIGNSTALSQANPFDFAGHTFLGWSTSASAATPSTTFTVSAAVTLYAVWSLNSYTVTYDANDDSSKTRSQTLTFGNGSALNFASGWTRTGYTLLGWSTNATASAATKSFSVASDVTLYAVWSLNSYTITYGANDGSGKTQTQTLSYGDTTGLDFANPWSRDGYTCVGWSTNRVAAWADSSFTVSSAGTLYAVWHINTFTVTYDANDDSGNTQSQVLDYGDTTGLSFANPWSRDGYNFVGWSIDSAAAVADSSLTVSNDLTLYAIWVVKSYDVTYQANDSSSRKMVERFKLGFADALNEPKIWSRTGYTFLGWSSSAHAVAPDTDFTVASDATFYAVWKKNPAGTFTVSYAINDGSGAIEDHIFASGSRNALAQTTDATFDGHTFLGWAANQKATSPDKSLTISADLTLYAVWSINTYVVSYNKNDGSIEIQTVTLNFGDTAALTHQVSSLREGYAFAGWSADPLAAEPDANLTVSTDVSLYAVWYLITNFVTFDSNDGTTNTLVEQWIQGFTGATSEPKIWSRTGYTFLGWSANANATSADKPFKLMSDLTLYAVWRANAAGTVTVTYSNNDGTLTSQDLVFTIGSKTALARSNSWSFYGHTFVGWSIDPTATGPDSELTLTTETTLFAVWALKSFTVTYSANGGLGSNETQRLDFGDGTALEYESSQTKKGFGFVGWSVDPAAIAPDDSFVVAGDATLYAVWSRNSYTVTYDANDDSGNLQEETLMFGDIGALGYPSPWYRDGYAFMGWSADSMALYPDDSFTVTDDSTLFAIWHQNSDQVHTITFHSADGADQVQSFDYLDGATDVFDYSNPWYRDGYEFLGWSIDSLAAVPDSRFVALASTDLFAVWKLITHTVTYDSGDGTGRTRTAVVRDGNSTALLFANPWVRTGYTLLGWSSDSTATAADLEIQIYDDTTLFAIWHKNSAQKHSVSYYSADGKGNIVSVEYTDGSVLALNKTNPWPRDGYNFLGWSANYGSSAADERFVVIKDTTLFAIWSQADPAVLGDFPNRRKALSARTYKLIAPTSNSHGAVSYSLDCADIATLRADVVTLVGVGTCDITVVVAAKPGFGEATATMTLTITPTIKAIKVTPPKNGDPLVSDDGNDVINLVHTSTVESGLVSLVSDDPYTPENRWALSIQSATAKGSSTPLDAKKFLNFLNLGKVIFVGSGYMPETQVIAYIGATQIGTVTTDATGAFSISFVVPKTIKLGSQYIQLNGISNSNTIRSVSQLIVIKAPTVTLKKSVIFAGVTTKLNAAASKILVAIKTALKGKSNIVISITSLVKTASNIKADVKIANTRATAIIKALQKTYKVVATYSYKGYTLSPKNKPKIPRLDLVITYN